MHNDRVVQLQDHVIESPSGSTGWASFDPSIGSEPSCEDVTGQASFDSSESLCEDNRDTLSLRVWLLEAGVSGESLDRVVEALAAEDIESVSTLRIAWPEARGSVRAYPRTLIQHRLEEPPEREQQERAVGGGRGLELKRIVLNFQIVQAAPSPQAPRGAQHRSRVTDGKSVTASNAASSPHLTQGGGLRRGSVKRPDQLVVVLEWNSESMNDPATRRLGSSGHRAYEIEWKALIEFFVDRGKATAAVRATRRAV